MVDLSTISSSTSVTSIDASVETTETSQTQTTSSAPTLADVFYKGISAAMGLTAPTEESNLELQIKEALQEYDEVSTALKNLDINRRNEWALMQRAEFRAALAQYTQVGQNLALLQTQYDTQDAEVTTLENNKITLESEKAALEATENDYLAEKDTYLTTEAELDAEEGGYKATETTLLTRQTTLQNQEITDQAEVDRLTSEIATKNEDLVTLLASQSDSSTQSQAEIDLRAEINVLDADLITANSALTSTQGDLLTVAGEISDNEVNLLDVADRITVNDAKITELNAKLSNSATDITAKDAEIAAAASDILDAKSDLSDIAADMADEALEVAYYTAITSSLRAVIISLNGEISGEVSAEEEGFTLTDELYRLAGEILSQLPDHQMSLLAQNRDDALKTNGATIKTHFVSEMLRNIDRTISEGLNLAKEALGGQDATPTGRLKMLLDNGRI